MTELPFINYRDFTGKMDVVNCQMAIHFLPHQKALKTIKALSAMLKPGGKLFLSAAGMSSKLSENYPDISHDVSSRFSRLSKTVSEKYGVTDPICLYWLDEMKWIVSNSGLLVEQAFRNDFGDVNVVGVRNDSRRR
jgi:SAM-dependent methyltransferase